MNYTIWLKSDYFDEKLKKDSISKLKDVVIFSYLKL